MRKRLKKLLLLAIALLCAWTLFLTVSILWYAGQRGEQRADAAVVLGAAVAGSVPTPVFEERIRHAIDLYRNGRVRALILTGGLAEGDKLSESEAAREYCLRHGVPANAIFIEKRSRSTLENLVYAKPLIVSQHYDSVLIVSDPLHMRRAMTMADDLKIRAYPSPTPTTRYTGLASQTKFLFRETWYYAQYLLFQRLSSLT
jgi:uncharacterized SAM-binding protein YcdF (DUF218 family)